MTQRNFQWKYLDSFEMWCWSGMEEIKLPDKVTNEEVLGRIEEKKTLLDNILRRKGNCIGHILRRIYLLRDTVQEQMTEVKAIGG